MAEIFVTAGKHLGVPGVPRRGRARVLIIFYVAFCMEPAQAKHNEALGMRVTSHEPSVFRAAPDPATLPRHREVPGLAFCASEEIE